MLRKIVIFLLLVCCVGQAACAAGKKFTLVIDAGHGGRDAGAVGDISKEKDLTLKYALAIGQFIESNCPDVKVVYTRKTDKFLELWQRAEIANKNKADLFISVHINSLPKGHAAHGFQTYTLGKGRVSGSKKGYIENLEVAKRENDVILLEPNYKQTYHGYDPNSPESNIMFEFMQDKNMEYSVDLAKHMQKYVCAATGRQDMGAYQDNLAVLRLSSMPGCLIELGFISTKDEERFLNSKAALERYARGVYNAFMAYRKKKPMANPAPLKLEPQETVAIPQIVPKKEQQPAPVPAAVEQAVAPVGQKTDTLQAEAVKTDSLPSAPVFKVQILTSNQRLKEGDARLLGVAPVDCYEEGRLFKYTVGSSANYSEIWQLRKSLSEKFPQAFIVAFRDGAKMDVNEAIRAYKSNKVKK